ncbi:hypothetical protein GCM10011415_04290 [Salipiger pallidus]|uniref:Yip1 domain-containing protein n=1 Tax=Salipiger pallidus TaxID=1775170 RepID=A0A8J2ZGW8_9RHOB|nr:YIP1 family protein [Salipiger pallidus]GGG61354.1 hypothetical protein GCM10011415_04290 [Salipiger pallidus]
MTAGGVMRLALETVMAPRMVAQHLLAQEPGREAALTLFALAVVLNALVAGLTLAMAPGTVLPLGYGPVMVAILLGTVLLLLVSAIGSFGRMWGGTGRNRDILFLLSWAQILRAGLQFVLLLLGVVSAGSLGSVLAIAGAVVGIWILANFIDVAHGFGNAWKAAMVLIMAGALASFVLVSVMMTLGFGPDTGINDV